MIKFSYIAIIGKFWRHKVELFEKDTVGRIRLLKNFYQRLKIDTKSTVFSGWIDTVFGPASVKPVQPRLIDWLIGYFEMIKFSYTASIGKFWRHKVELFEKDTVGRIRLLKNFYQRLKIDTKSTVFSGWIDTVFGPASVKPVQPRLIDWLIGYFEMIKFSYTASIGKFWRHKVELFEKDTVGRIRLLKNFYQRLKIDTKSTVFSGWIDTVFGPASVKPVQPRLIDWLIGYFEMIKFSYTASIGKFWRHKVELFEKDTVGRIRLLKNFYQRLKIDTKSTVFSGWIDTVFSPPP